MRMRNLGGTGLKVTELGFGGGAIGGLYSPVPRETALEAMQAAWDAGMRYFDTAPFYGHGLSERRVGDFLRDKSEYVLSTKVGALLRPVPREEVPDNGFFEPLPFAVDFDYSHDAIMRSVEQSFQRLGLNRIDVLYVHALERGTLGETYEAHLHTFLSSGIKAMERLRAAAVISGWGLGVNEVEPCLSVMEETRLDCLLLANRYTLLDRRAESQLMPRCLAQGTGVVIGGVFNSGILAIGAVPGAHFDYAEPLPDIAERVRGLEAVAAAQGGTLAAAALHFALRHEAVSSVVIGSAKASSLARNVALLGDGTDWDWERFEAFVLR